jgi:hypothetical protein
MANRQVAAEEPCSGYQNLPMIAKTAHAATDTMNQ